MFYGADDVEIIKGGIQQWRRSLGLDDYEDLTQRYLMNLGMPLLREWIHQERERRAAADLVKLDASELAEGVANDEGGEDDSSVSEGDAEVTEFAWTAELVADYCARILRRAARHHIRLKWLRRISMATITYIPAGKKRRSTGPRNTLKDHSPEVSRQITPSPILFDEEDPGRVRLLISELRRNEAKGGVWQVVKPWPMAVPFWI